MVRNDIIFSKLFSFSVILVCCPTWDFVYVFIAILCSSACDAGGPQRRGAFPGFLEGAGSLFPSLSVGPGVSMASHPQPVPVLAVAGCRQTASATELWSEWRYLMPGFEGSWWSAQAPLCLSITVFLFLPPPRHLSLGYEKAFCPSFFPYTSPAELQAHPRLHSHLPGG